MSAVESTVTAEVRVQVGGVSPDTCFDRKTVCGVRSEGSRWTSCVTRYLFGQEGSVRGPVHKMFQEVLRQSPVTPHGVGREWPVFQVRRRSLHLGSKSFYDYHLCRVGRVGSDCGHASRKPSRENEVPFTVLLGVCQVLCVGARVE